MKKYLSLLFSGLIVLLFFVTPGQSVKAAESDQVFISMTSGNGCGCNVTPILGAEKNKIIADLISSEEFKAVKKEAKNKGYKWNGVHNIQVVNYNSEVILVAVPFINTDGTVELFGFNNGHYRGHQPA